MYATAYGTVDILFLHYCQCYCAYFWPSFISYAIHRKSVTAKANQLKSKPMAEKSVTASKGKPAKI